MPSICASTPRPLIGKIKLDMVMPSDVAKMHRQIGKDKPMTANRVVECIGSVYRYAATCGLVKRGHNPAAYIEAFREQRRERFLSSQELGRLETQSAKPKPLASHGRLIKRNRPRNTFRRPTAHRIDPHAAAALRLPSSLGHACAKSSISVGSMWTSSAVYCCCRIARQVAKRSSSMRPLSPFSGLPRVGSFVIIG